MVGFQKIAQYIHMLCPGRFILIESVFLDINYSKLLFSLKVKAFDGDSKANGEIQYHKINGDSQFIDSVEIDVNTGDLFLVSNKGFDRETTESNDQRQGRPL